MSDLIQTLRTNAICDHANIDVPAVCRTAADEIERLRAENKELKSWIFNAGLDWEEVSDA